MTETRMVHKAYRVALDPTPEQLGALASHAGARRHIFNWGVQRVAEWLDAAKTGAELPKNFHFALCTQWVEYRNAHANDPEPPPGQRRTNTGWVHGNISSSTQQAACRDAAGAWQNFFKSRNGQRAGRTVGRPKFKKKGRAVESFQAHGNVRLVAPTSTHSIKVRLPMIGDVRVLSDDAHHPALIRARKRARGQRHLGNRRRIRQLWEQCADAQQKALLAHDILTTANDTVRLPTATILGRLNGIAAHRAVLAATIDAKDRLTKAERALAKLGPKANRERAEKNVAVARKILTEAANKQPKRVDLWTEPKLAGVIKTGTLEPQQARDLADAYQLKTDTRQRLIGCAAQARIIKVTATLGPEGLWWLSIGAEVPQQIHVRVDRDGVKRPSPTRKQAARGTVGVDLGVREIATVSDGTLIRNPRFLQEAQAELRAAQKALSRCVPGSARYAKAKAAVGLLHAEVARFRTDGLHRATTWLARRYAGIVIEGWNVQQTMSAGSKDLPRRVRRNRNRALSDTGIGAGRQQLQYKGERLGVTITVTDEHSPTGRTCSRCRWERTNPIPPWQELFACDRCGLILPRRMNTARHLATVGSGPPPGGSVQSRGGGVSPAAPAPSGAGSGRRPPSKRAATSSRAP